MKYILHQYTSTCRAGKFDFGFLSYFLYFYQISLLLLDFFKIQCYIFTVMKYEGVANADHLRSKSTYPANLPGLL